eukprot:gene11329-3363_t
MQRFPAVPVTYFGASKQVSRFAEIPPTPHTDTHTVHIPLCAESVEAATTTTSPILALRPPHRTAPRPPY